MSKNEWKLAGDKSPKLADGASLSEKFMSVTLNYAATCKDLKETLDLLNKKLSELRTEEATARLNKETDWAERLCFYADDIQSHLTKFQ